MTPSFRDSALVLIMAGLMVAGIYLLSASQDRIAPDALALSPETERLREELVKLSSDIDATTLEGRSCRASLAGMLYELRKDSVRARSFLAERAQKQTLQRTLHGATLGFGLATLILGIALLAAASRGRSDGAQGDGSVGRLWSPYPGIAAMGASAVAFGVLAFLPGPDLPEPAATAPLKLDMAAFVERCEDYRRKEE